MTVGGFGSIRPTVSNFKQHPQLRDLAACYARALPVTGQITLIALKKLVLSRIRKGDVFRLPVSAYLLSEDP